MRSLSLLLLLLLVAFAGSAQEFAIRTLEMTATEIVIHYDLRDSAKGHSYSVFVYTSRDNFLAPIAKVSGDAGIQVKPGLNKKIVWNAFDELGPAFKGDVELEVRGRLYVPFINFVGFEDVPIRKRKTPFIVKWTGGTRQNVLNFQLYQGDRLVHSYANIPNEFEYKLELPGSIRPGSGYYFRITDSKNKDQIVITPEFIVKRKIPLVYKAVAVAGIGLVTWILVKPEPSAPEVDLPPTLPE